MISTADGALVEVSNMLQRMRELALQASNGTTTEADRNYLNSEYANLISEIDRIAQNTQWNGRRFSTTLPQRVAQFLTRSVLTAVRPLP